ncbi:FecR domain-containing protein [Marinobacteraceae bacterium S3BR75-40.1]
MTVAFGPRNQSCLNGIILLLILVWSTSALAELPLGYGSTSGRSVSATYASMEEQGDWTYTLRPNDSVQSIARELLSRHHDYRDLLRYNRLNSSREAIAGTTLSIPIGWLRQRPQPAKAISVIGSVIYQPHLASGYRPLEDGTLLNVGDRVRTVEGRVIIKLADDSRIRLGERSMLVFDRLTQYGKTGMADTRLRLERGRLETQVQPIQEGGSRFEIETPSAVAAVRGTVFRLKAHNGNTRLEVTKGMVGFGPRGHLKDVPAGYGAAIGTNGAVRISPLPPEPKLATLPQQVDKLPFAIGWQGNSAAAYRVDVIDEKTDRWVLSREVSRGNFNLGHLQNGEYRLEVASIAPNGMTGRQATQTFRVDLTARKATPTAPAAGATTDDNMPSFQWDYHGNNELGRVEVSDEPDFSNLIAVSEWATDDNAIVGRPLRPGQYYWRVVTEAGGTSVATSEGRSLIIQGELQPARILSINYVDNQVRVFWNKVPQASEYTLQLARDPSFEKIIKEATIRDTTAALRLIPGQRYFVRLRGETDQPLKSRWGPGRELFVE